MLAFLKKGVDKVDALKNSGSIRSRCFSLCQSHNWGLSTAPQGYTPQMAGVNRLDSSPVVSSKRLMPPSSATSKVYAAG